MSIEKVVDWGTVFAMLSVLGILIGIATVFLKLFIANEIAKLKDELSRSFNNAVYSRELTDSRFNEVYGRLRFLEEWRHEQIPKKS